MDELEVWQGNSPKCNFTGTLKSALNGVDKSEEVAGNRFTGRKYYPNSDEGELIIE